MFGNEKSEFVQDTPDSGFCPINDKSNVSCSFHVIDGHVRDFPSVGVEQCRICKLIRHRVDLRSHVNYPDGSMSATTSDTNCGESYRDQSRRLKSITDLAKMFDISKVLDFGCGAGQMIETLGGRFLVEGLEIDKSARRFASQFGKVYGSLEEVENTGAKFDLITLFHVVEHLYDPRETLKRVRALVRPGGFIILETPNAEDALLKVYGSSAFANFTYWSHHPYLYSHEALESLCRSLGFTAFSYSGIQRYGLTNHLYWLSKGLPGGHEVWNSMLKKSTEEAYADDLIARRIQDTLWFVARV